MSTDEVDLGRVLRAVRRRVWLVLLFTLLGASAGVYLSIYWLEPVYRSSATLIIIEERPELVDLESLRLGRTLTSTYAQIARSRRVATAVLEMLGTEVSEETVTAMLARTRAQPVRDTELIRIDYHAHSPWAAQRGIEAWITVFIAEIKMIMNIDNVSVVDPPSLPAGPVFPRPDVNGAVGGLAAMMLSLVLALVLEYRDDTIRDEHDVSEVLGLPVLTKIIRFQEAPVRMAEPNPSQSRRRTIRPDDRDRWRSVRGRLATALDPGSRVLECYRRLRTNLQFIDVEIPARSLMITSAGPAEGKSLTASNLAVVMAQAGRNICLVDADLRRPTLDRAFRVSNYSGLTDILVSGSQYSDYLHRIPIGCEDGPAPETLDLLPSGMVPPNPSDLLASERFLTLITALSESYDCVIFDGPPILPVNDALSLAPRVDGVLFVVSSGNTRYSAAREALDQVNAVGARVLGTVVNSVRQETWERYYRRHSFDYYAYRGRSGRSRRR